MLRLQISRHHHLSGRLVPMCDEGASMSQWKNGQLNVDRIRQRTGFNFPPNWPIASPRICTHVTQHESHGQTVRADWSIKMVERNCHSLSDYYDVSDNLLPKLGTPIDSDTAAAIEQVRTGKHKDLLKVYVVNLRFVLTLCACCYLWSDSFLVGHMCTLSFSVFLHRIGLSIVDFNGNFRMWFNSQLHCRSCFFSSSWTCRSCDYIGSSLCVYFLGMHKWIEIVSDFSAATNLWNGIVCMLKY